MESSKATGSGMTMTKDYTKKAILLGFGLLAAQLMWTLYNTYMPLFLQAGRQSFSSGTVKLGFGLSATLAGFIMTLDNIAAFFIQPLMGPISDRTKTRIGRRMPFILVCAPLSALFFALIPIGPMQITPELSGNLAALSGPFALTIASALGMVLFMALWRTPLFALLPDLFPSPLRSQANAIVNIMAGIGGILVFVVGGMLFGIYGALPFWFGALVTMAAVVVLYCKVREPKELEEAADVPGGLKILAKLRMIPAAHKKSLTLLVLTVFFYMMGYMAIETFFSSFAVTKLGLKPSVAGLLLSVASISFLIFAMPSAAVAKKFGRKKTISLGLLVFSAALVVIWLFPTVPLAAAMLFLGGFGWALININGLPMILDTSTSEDMMGTFSGLYFIATTLAGTLGPLLNGSIIDLVRGDYRVIFLVCPVFFLLSFLALLGVSTGEVKAAGMKA